MKPESSECTFSLRFAFEKQNISQMIQLDYWVNCLGLGQWGSNRIRRIARIHKKFCFQGHNHYQ